MKIAVDVHGHTRIFQGSRTFLFHLYKAISDFYPGADVTTFGSIEPPTFPRRNHIAVDLNSPYKRLTYGSWMVLKERRPDFVHYQYFCPVIPVGQSVITIHDVLPLTHPQYFDSAFAQKFRAMLSLSVRLASRINVVSDFSRDAVSDMFGIPPGQIDVVPNGVEIDPFVAIDKRDAAHAVFERFGLRNYVVAIGRIELRKNIGLLIDAVERLRGSGYPDLNLVLIGTIDKTSGSQCRRTLSALGAPWLRHFADIDDQEKATILRSSRVMVFPSLAEGFGIPPLEAMAAEVPVIVANQTAHGQIYRSHALMVGGTDSTELATKIEHVLADDQLHQALVKKGRELAKTYSWQRSASVFIESLSQRPKS